MESELNKYDNINADDAQFISEIKAIVYTAKQKAYQAADLYQVVSNWLVGRRIVEQEQHGKERAQYEKHIVELASEALTAEFGKGYSVVNIKSFRKFYLTFNNLLMRLCRNSVLRRSLSFRSIEVWIFFRRLIFEDYSKIIDSQAIKIGI
ncbi:MAG: hypothetical protein K1V81_00645 [Paramuribaculum sp.]